MRRLICVAVATFGIGAIAGVTDSIEGTSEVSGNATGNSSLCPPTGFDSNDVNDDNDDIVIADWDFLTFFFNENFSAIDDNGHGTHLTSIK